MNKDLVRLLSRHLKDPRSGWSCGGFGAVAEFVWDVGETIEFREPTLEAFTARGAIRIDLRPDSRAIAYELTARDEESWQHGLALCLPEAAAAGCRRTVLTEIGPDRGAVRQEDRDAILFDLGLGISQTDACVRSADPETIALLRSAIGQPWLFHPAAKEMPRLSPHRVFVSPLGRVEVFQPIPAPDGVSPEGPHTHVLPRLLSHGLTHAANIPLPDGWIPCVTLFPPNSQRTASGDRKPFTRDEHEAFQAIWRAYGDARLVALKDAVFAGNAPPDDDLSRAERAVVRVAERQMSCLKRVLAKSRVSAAQD